MEDLVRVTNEVDLAGDEALGNAGSIQKRTDDVRGATEEDVVETHHIASVAEAAGEDDVADGDDGREAERDEGERAVPAVVAVVGREDDLESAGAREKRSGGLT